MKTRNHKFLLKAFAVIYLTFIFATLLVWGINMINNPETIEHATFGILE